MKKLILAIGVCFLLVTMPVMTAFPIQKQSHIKNQLPLKTTSTILNNDTPPD